MRNLSPRAECLIVLTIAFGYPLFGAAWNVSNDVVEFEFDDLTMATVCLFDVSVLLLVGTLLKIRGWTADAFPVRPSIADTLRGVALYAAGVAVYWVALFITILAYGSVDPVGRVQMVSTTSLPIMVLVSCINPVFEEALVVGYVTYVLRGRGAAVAIGASTLLRLLYHAYQGPLALLAIMPMGLMFAGYYWRRRNLWPLFVGHAVGDFAALLLVR